MMYFHIKGKHVTIKLVLQSGHKRSLRNVTITKQDLSERLGNVHKYKSK